MQCWKSINVEHRSGEQHLIGLSLITFIISFLVLYVTFSFIIDINQLSDQFFPMFIVILVLLYPIHKLLHVIPLLLLKEPYTIYKRKHLILFLIMHIKITNPIKKHKYVLLLLMPFIVINCAILCFIVAIPQYAHFSTLLLSFHIAICTSDLVYLKALLRSPKRCLIEENDSGYEILLAENEEEFRLYRPKLRNPSL